ncbi:hypothetical protein Tco_0054414 [Tanacetum coccineum]
MGIKDECIWEFIERQWFGFFQGVSLSDKSMQTNGEFYCIVGAIGGIAGTMGEIVGVSVGISGVSSWMAGKSAVGAVAGTVVGIVPNKITRAVDVPTLSADESDEIEMTEKAMTCTSNNSYKSL